MTSVLRGLTALWLDFCAWRARRWLRIWRERQEAAEGAAARYRLWLVRAGRSETDEG